LAQLGLYIKARKKLRTIGNLNFNVVSSDFFLPDYDEVKHIFGDYTKLDDTQKKLISDIWGDLQFAYKYGSLIRLDENLKANIHSLEEDIESGKYELFASGSLAQEENFTVTFFSNLKIAVEQTAKREGNTFLTNKTRDAITFLELLTTEYDVATTNPPYTQSGDFGSDLKGRLEHK